MLNTSNTYLGIDYGTKRVGIAVSDKAGQFAFPKKVIANKADIADLVSQCAAIAAEENVATIVIGESKNYDMKDNVIMEKARVFGDELAKKTGLPIHFHPEFLSSAQAAYFQGEGELLDASAAAIILQSYLDTLRYCDGNMETSGKINI